MSELPARPVEARDGLDSASAKPLRIALVLSLLAVVWIYARWGSAPPRAEQLSGRFERAVIFRIDPPLPVTEINVRAGPGRRYRIVGHLPKGGRVIGVEQLHDDRGAPWIRLAENRGFIKQSILIPEQWARR